MIFLHHLRHCTEWLVKVQNIHQFLTLPKTASGCVQWLGIVQNDWIIHIACKDMSITTNKLNMRKKLRRLHVFGNGHDLFDALEDQACVAWRRGWYFSYFFFIFLLHFRCDEFPFFQKWIDQKDRYQYLKQKQKRFLSSVQESRSTNPFLQLVHIIVKGTLSDDRVSKDQWNKGEIATCDWLKCQIWCIILTIWLVHTSCGRTSLALGGGREQCYQLRNINCKSVGSTALVSTRF